MQGDTVTCSGCLATGKLSVMDALLPFLPVIGAVLAIAGATPRVYRWWKWRRARVEAAERVNNRLAIKRKSGDTYRRANVTSTEE